MRKNEGKEEMKKQIYVKVPLNWLETLVRNQKSAEFANANPVSAMVFSVAIAKLIGHASSAESIIKYNGRIEE